MNDTDRLNFILKYFTIDDIGDEEAVPGICINHEGLEDDLTWGVPHGELNTRKSHFQGPDYWKNDIRDIIDKAIESHNQSLNLTANTTAS